MDAARLAVPVGRCRERRMIRRISPLHSITKHMAARRDLGRDWRRWNIAERIAAVLLGVLAAIGVPALLAGAHLS